MIDLRMKGPGRSGAFPLSSGWAAALRSQDMNRKDWTLGDGVADGEPILAR
jgi:hypothetical protein